MLPTLKYLICHEFADGEFGGGLFRGVYEINIL